MYKERERERERKKERDKEIQYYLLSVKVNKINDIITKDIF